MVSPAFKNAVVPNLVFRGTQVWNGSFLKIPHLEKWWFLCTISIRGFFRLGHHWFKIPFFKFRHFGFHLTVKPCTLKKSERAFNCFGTDPFQIQQIFLNAPDHITHRFDSWNQSMTFPRGIPRPYSTFKLWCSVIFHNRFVRPKPIHVGSINGVVREISLPSHRFHHHGHCISSLPDIQYPAEVEYAPPIEKNLILIFV